jgi:AhpD family alkylhydroperoxidase
MTPRLDPAVVSPALYKKFLEFSMMLRHSTIDAKTQDLVNIRASQINGCAFCVDMHSKEAKIHGERELRLYHIAIWRESPLFDARERAALAWTEAVTKLGEHGVPQEIYEEVRASLSEQEITDLTFAVMAINGWNRLSIAFQAVPGSKDAEYGLAKAGLS